VGCADIKNKEAVDSLISPTRFRLFDDVVSINETTFSTRRVKQWQPNLENLFGVKYNIKRQSPKYQSERRIQSLKQYSLKLEKLSIFSRILKGQAGDRIIFAELAQLRKKGNSHKWKFISTASIAEKMSSNNLTLLLIVVIN
jgi:hypothetical protein